MQGESCLVYRLCRVGKALTVARVFDGSAAESHTKLVGRLLNFVRL
ncbi:hypothetical protein XACLG97_11150002 [Xanthomonas citri pv. citri]|nr:hypothetical protein XAC1083_1090004 [Xanthomonas citri pv. citri]CEH39067.1 hypothetical protein XACLG97_11150002 [Xanthomonas citri pv. citri]CEH59777.1 hypothetical protein XACLE3_8740002 [Xanthomonas citri pv. citri]CEH99704.1 hypothetical protein XACB100_2670002 [Xanthomonas citri pv. citri]